MIFGRAVSAWSRLGALLSVLMVASSLALVVSTPANAAAELNIGPVRAQIQRLQNTETNEVGCYRVGPSSAPQTAPWSDWVNGGQEALAGHGTAVANPETGWRGGCPDAASRIGQSTLGITPTAATSITEGSPFLIATFKHYNNALDSATGLINTGLNLEINGKQLYYKFTLLETPNEPGFCQWQTWGAPYCDDIVQFSNVTSTETVTIDGGVYSLSFKGFTPAGANGVCSPDAGAVKTKWYTVENTTTTGCLYADLVRPTGTLTLLKSVVGGPNAASDFTLKAQSGGTTLAGKSGVTGTVGNGNYDLSETGPAGYKGSWTCTGGTMPTATSVTVPVNGNVTCTAVNTWDMGTFKVALDVKAVGNTPVAYQNPTRTFAVNYTCTLNGATTGNGTVNLADGKTTASIQAPLGSTCSVDTATPQRQAADFPDSSYTWVSPLQPAAITIGATEQTLKVVEQYSRGYGTFKVALDVKAVGNTPAAYQNPTRTFAVNYTCTLNGATTGNGTVNLADGKTTASIQAPLGSTCSVDTATPQRQAADFPDSSYTWVSPLQPAAITIGATEQTLKVVEQYSRGYGTFKVALDVKAVGNTPAAYQNPTRTFAVDYNCSLNDVATGSATLSVADGKTTASIQAPLGSICTADADLPQLQAADFPDSSYTWSAPSLPTAITVGATEQTLLVVERYQRNYGSLKVTKKISGPAASVVDPATSFSFDYNCGVGFSGSVSVTAGAPATTVAGLPLHADCTVVETARPTGSIGLPGWAQWTSAGSVTSGKAVVAQSPNTVTITNNTALVYGRVAVTKSVVGATAGLVTGSNFAVSIACTQPAGSPAADRAYQANLADGGTWTAPAGELLAGAACTISQDAAADDQLVNATYSWGAKPADAKLVTPAVFTASTTLTDTIYERGRGVFAVNVKVAPSVAVGVVVNDFTGSFRCSFGEGTRAVTTTGTWSAPALGGLATLRANGQIFTGNVPAGSTCSATQNAPTQGNLVDKSFAWMPFTIDSAVTVPEGQTATINAVNSTRRMPGSIGLKKAASAIKDLDGNGPDAGDTIDYTFRVTNNSAFAVTEVTVTDPMFGTQTFACSPSPLAAGASADCGGATHVITAAEVEARVVNNTATATAVPLHGGDVMRASDSTTTPVIPVPKPVAQPAKAVGQPPNGSQLPATGK